MIAQMPRPSTFDFRLGLMGFPLGHSLSPKIHAAALLANGLQGDYSLFSISPDDQQGLTDLLARVRNGELHGLNVTIPHKQNVIPLLDELTPTAQAIGAVNTIYFRDNKLIGENTDAPGFLADLKQTLPSAFRSPRSALILGAGGSARAVVYSLLADGWNVTLAARRIEQAEQLASIFSNLQPPTSNRQSPISNYQLPLTPHESFPFPLSSFSLLVNTTPLGMSPNADQSPLPESARIPITTAIYDLVYHPRETKLVRDAHTHGCLAVTGLGMLIEQAALAFEIWTGAPADREAMRKAVA
jgi:shikimate dehydrogenase